MTDYATQHDHTYVPDPYYGRTRDFEEVVELLEDACENLLITVGVRRVMSDEVRNFNRHSQLITSH